MTAEAVAEDHLGAASLQRPSGAANVPARTKRGRVDERLVGRGHYEAQQAPTCESLSTYLSELLALWKSALRKGSYE